MDNLRIAIQKNGRLSEPSLNLLERCGLEFDCNKRSLISRIKNYQVELMLVRDDDIPYYVRDGVCDLGIVGLNQLTENLGVEPAVASPVTIIRRLGYGTCKLSLAWPKARAYEGLNSFSGKKIATSYPRILRQFLDQRGITADIVIISGSVELTPSIDVADAICDLVSTGATLASNGLKEVYTILESEAVLVRSRKHLDETQEAFIQKLTQRIDSCLLAESAKYVMMNAPRTALQHIIELIPGMEDPTVIPLSQDSEKFAIHAVAKGEVVWETMEELKAAGASSILVLPIEKVVQ